MAGLPAAVSSSVKHQMVITFVYILRHAAVCSDLRLLEYLSRNRVISGDTRAISSQGPQAMLLYATTRRWSSEVLPRLMFQAIRYRVGPKQILVPAFGLGCQMRGERLTALCVLQRLSH